MEFDRYSPDGERGSVADDFRAEDVQIAGLEVGEVTIEMAATSNVVLPGHRIRLEVSSSNFPRYDRNTNTGGEISAESAADMVSAVNTVHHGPEHPSRLTLPVIRR
nr:CocE/NonD family hydrolase [Streptomyces sp. SID2888]